MSEHDAAHHHSADDEYRETPPGAGHEHTDAEIGPIVKFAVWIVVIAIVVHFGAFGLFAFWVDQTAAENVNKFPLAATDTGLRLPQGPWRLQRFPANEAYEYKLQERHMVTTYGWVDRSAGTVRIPIEAAMQRALSRGFAVRGATAPAASDQASAEAPVAPEPDVRETPGLMPSDSSAGRVMERRRQ